MRESSKSFHEKNKIRKYQQGATFVPLEAALSFQHDILDRTIEVTVDNQVANNDGINLKFSRYWPKILYPCHQSSFHGYQVIIVPRFSGGLINKKLWQIVAFLTQVDKVWQISINAIKNSSNWYGWVIAYITKKYTVLFRNSFCSHFDFNTKCELQLLFVYWSNCKYYPHN